MNETGWYHMSQGQRHGPIALAELKQRLEGGSLSPQEVVWRDGMAEWTPARAVPELWGGGPPPPPPVGYYAPPPGMTAAPGDSAGIRMLIPVGRSGWAIAAGYLGLFSVLLIFGPFAILCAVLAIREIRRDKTKHGMGRAVFGLGMGVLGSFGLVMMLASRWFR